MSLTSGFDESRDDVTRLQLDTKMASLIEQVKTRKNLDQSFFVALTRYPGFLDAIKSVNPPGGWKVMVVDDHSKRLLNAVLKDNDVLGERVTGKYNRLFIKWLAYMFQ
jgi:hypothetical protein